MSDRQRLAHNASCRNCGLFVRLYLGECRACYMYRHRHGIARPEELVVRCARRVFEQQEQRRWLRQIWARAAELS